MKGGLDLIYLASPKSQSLSTGPETRRFYGLRSLWKNPFLCMCMSALASWKSRFLSVVVFTWFLFPRRVFLLFCVWSTLRRDWCLGTRRRGVVLLRRGVLLWVWWCWGGWVFWVIWFIWVLGILASCCIFVSSFWWRLLRWFGCWLPCRRFRRLRLRGWLLSYIFTFRPDKANQQNKTNPDLIKTIRTIFHSHPNFNIFKHYRLSTTEEESWHEDYSPWLSYES